MNDLLSFLDQGAGYQKNACNVKSNSDTIEISTPRDRQKRKNMEASNIEKKAFERLNEFLLKEDIWISVICVGGFVLNHYGVRTTHDIDVFYQTSAKLEQLIKKVGDELEINTEEELWNSVQNMNKKPPDEICTVVYEYSNLKVLIPPLDYVAGMKLESARERDIDDVASIIKLLKIETPAELQKKIEGYGFTIFDESLLLEAFGIAYVMEWLEKYYTDNEDSLFS